MKKFFFSFMIFPLLLIHHVAAFLNNHSSAFLGSEFSQAWIFDFSPPGNSSLLHTKKTHLFLLLFWGSLSGRESREHSKGIIWKCATMSWVLQIATFATWVLDGYGERVCDCSLNRPNGGEVLSSLFAFFGNSRSRILMEMCCIFKGLLFFCVTSVSFAA